MKWDNFPESQATWEPEDNLDCVKWMIEEFNEKYGRKLGVRRKLEREKLAKLSERRRKKEKNKRDVDSLEFNTQLEEEEEETTKKTAKLSPETQSPPSPHEENKSCSPIDQAKIALQRAILEETSSNSLISMANVKMVRGNLALDVAVKILGCRKQGKTVFYAVLFKKRSDEGVVVVPQVCTHEELRVQAPWLLSQYLLDCARTDQGP